MDPALILKKLVLGSERRLRAQIFLARENQAVLREQDKTEPATRSEFTHN